MAYEKKVEAMIKNNKELNFKIVGLSLMFSRFSINYQNNPTQEMLNKCLEEFSAFTKKYESIIQEDLEKINLLGE